MSEIVRLAVLNDLNYVVDLSKKESKSIGFIPKMAYESAITGVKTGKRWSNICNDKLFVITNNGDLVGFCLASFGLVDTRDRRGKIAQIILQEDARMLTRGKLLLNAVTQYGENRGTFNFGCGCADDLESNKFWKAMGWNFISQRNGISHSNTWKQTSDRKVNIYYIDDYRQYDLFKKEDI